MPLVNVEDIHMDHVKYQLQVANHINIKNVDNCKQARIVIVKEWGAAISHTHASLHEPGHRLLQFPDSHRGNQAVCFRFLIAAA